MRTKRATILTLISIMILGFWYLVTANSLRKTAFRVAVDPSYFPKLLAVFLLILCSVCILMVYKNKNDEKLNIPNLKLIVLTIAITILFILNWRTFGYFYIQAFIFLVLLLSIYNMNYSFRAMLINSTLSLFVICFIYFLFGHWLNISF